MIPDGGLEGDEQLLPGGSSHQVAMVVVVVGWRFGQIPDDGVKQRWAGGGLLVGW